MNELSFFEVLRQDAKRYRCGRRHGKFRLLAIWWLFPGFRFTVLFRLRALCSRRGHRLLTKLLTLCLLRSQLKTGIQINAGCQIGPGLYIPHYGNIVVNPEAQIGANAYISHNVTIGRVHSGKRQGVPVIGDGVFLGAGAVVVGNVRIGDDVVVSPNSVVVTDVPDSAVVSGIPARVLSMKGARVVLGEESAE